MSVFQGPGILGSRRKGQAIYRKRALNYARAEQGEVLFPTFHRDAAFVIIIIIELAGAVPSFPPNSLGNARGKVRPGTFSIIFFL